MGRSVAVFEALQKVTGQDLNSNENFVVQNGQLVYGDDWEHLVTQEHYNQAEYETFSRLHRRDCARMTVAGAGQTRSRKMNQSVIKSITRLQIEDAFTFRCNPAAGWAYEICP